MRRSIIFLTFTVLVLLLIHPLGEGDTWMHIKSGQLMIERMQVMSIDEYSYTMSGKKWLNHQWLSQIIFYIVYKFISVNGLILFSVIVIFFAFILLFINIYRRDNWLLPVFLILLIILFSQREFLARPLVFSLFLFSLFIFILHRYKYAWPPEKEKWLYTLIPLQILWVNLHGASIMGVFIVWAYIAGEFIDHIRGFKNESVIKGDKYKRLLYTGILLVIATGITPYGYDAILFPIKEFKGMYFIDEWSPSVYKNTLLNVGVMPYFRLFLIISMFTFIFRANFISSTHIIIFASLLYLSLSGKRHIPFYGLAMAPCIIEYLKGLEFKKIPLYVKKIFIQIVCAALVIYLALLSKDIFTGRYYVKQNMDCWVGLGRVGYPADAVDFILRSGLKGNMFNDYGSGCLLIWGLYPSHKVFLDGRNTIYGVKFIKENYIRYLIFPPPFERLAKKHDINYVFLYYGMSGTGELVPYLYHSKDWALVYFDDKVCIFAKNADKNADIIKRYRVDLTKRKRVARLNRYDWQSVYPREYIDRAAFYERVGLTDAAIETLKDVIKLMPDIGTAHYNLGSLYLKKEAYQDALREFNTAIMINRKDIDAYNNLGVTYARLGKYKDAIAQFRKALWVEPLCVEAMRNIRIAKKDYENQKFLYKNAGM